MPATYENLGTTTLGSAQASITFSSISANYTDLLIVGNFGVTTGTPVLYFRLNSDSTASYSHTHLGGNGTAAQSGRGSSESYGWAGFSLAGSPNDITGTTLINFFNYSNTTTNKTIIGRSGAAGREADTSVVLWRNTSAINSIVLTLSNSTTFLSGSTFTLYGIKAA
jgi:hypothetical protein